MNIAEWPTVPEMQVVEAQLQGCNLQQVARVSGVSISSIQHVKNARRMVTKPILGYIKEAIALIEQDPSRGAVPNKGWWTPRQRKAAA